MILLYNNIYGCFLQWVLEAVDDVDHNVGNEKDGQASAHNIIEIGGGHDEYLHTWTRI